MLIRSIVLTILFGTVILPVSATDNCSNLPAPATLTPNGLEPTPPFGYTTWYDQYTTPTESHIKAMSDLLVSTGLKAAWGNATTTVEVTEGWQGGRDGSGNLFAEPTRFPSGIVALYNYIHNDGLTVTAYTSPYLTSCAGNVGSGLHEQQDANNFASWGADRLEYDGCNVSQLYPSCYQSSAPQIWQYMAQFIRATGRPMQMMVGATDIPWQQISSWASTVGWNEWRITFWVNGTATDLNGHYNLFNDPGGTIDLAQQYASYQKVGFFDHCDYIIGQVENGIFGTFTTTQTQTQFGMCSLWGGPIILGMDISTLTGSQITMFKNSDVIAIDQDSLGKMATRFSQVSCGSATCEIWAKPLHDGTYAIGMLNRDSASHSITVNFTQFGGNPSVRDLWAQTNLGVMTSYTTTVVGYGLALLKATPQVSGSQVNNGKVINTIVQ